MKEVSEKEYQDLKKKLEVAESNLQNYHGEKGRHWIFNYHYFFSNSDKPCIYTPGTCVPCIYTGNQVEKTKKVPKNFNKGVWGMDIYHFSPKGCPNLTMKDYVLCLAESEDKYYFGRHKVGKCPHKKGK